MDFQLIQPRAQFSRTVIGLKKFYPLDANTPEALSVMFSKEIKNSKKSEGRSELLQELEMEQILLGLLQESPDAWLKSSDSVQLDENEIMKYISRRNEARRNKDFKTADKIRDQLIEKNILLKDGTKGTDWELIEKVKHLPRFLLVQLSIFTSSISRFFWPRHVDSLPLVHLMRKKLYSEYGIRKGLWLSVMRNY